MIFLIKRTLEFQKIFWSGQFFLLLGLFLIGCSSETKYIYIEEPITEHSLLHEIYDAMTLSGSYGNGPKSYFWKDNITPTKHYLNSSYTSLPVLEAGKNLIKDLRYCVGGQNNDSCEDRFSAVLTKTQADNLNANFFSQSFGFFPQIYTIGAFSLFVIIQEVLPYSPFSIAGIGRGDRILSFNGLDATSSANHQEIYNNFYNGVYFNQPVNIEWKSKKDNITYNKSINVSSYTTSDIINTDDSMENNQTDRFHKTVMMVTNRNNVNEVQKVGYLVYKSYTERSKQELKELFAYWHKRGVTNKAIIDLRYNGGGLVDTAQTLISLLTTNHTSSNFTTRLIFNDAYTRLNNTKPFISSTKVDLSTAESYSPQHNFKNLYFLVGEGTASASEMTIIGIKPFVNILVIGKTTAGKGVGQSPYLDRTGQYNLRLINFRYENSLGESVPRTGIVPDYSVAGERDNIKPWGHGEPLFDEAVWRIFNPNTPTATTFSSSRQIASSPNLSSSKTISKTSNDDIKKLNWYKDNYQRLVGF